MSQSPQSCTPPPSRALSASPGGPRPLSPGASEAARCTSSAGPTPDRELRWRLRQAEEKCGTSADFGLLLLQTMREERHEHELTVERLESELRACAGNEDLCRREADQLRARLWNADQERRRLQDDWNRMRELVEEEREQNALRSQLPEAPAHRVQLAAPSASPQSLLRTPMLSEQAPRGVGFTHTPTPDHSPLVSSPRERRRHARCASAAVQTSPQDLHAGGGGFFYGAAPEIWAAVAGAGHAPPGAPDGEAGCVAGTPSPPSSVSGSASHSRQAPLAAPSPPSSGSPPSVPTLAEELQRAASRDGLIVEERDARAVLADEEQAEGGVLRRHAQGVQVAPRPSERGRADLAEGAARELPRGAAAVSGTPDAEGDSDRARRLQRIRNRLRFLLLLREGLFGPGSSFAPSLRRPHSPPP
eukprot:TRINITY_DN5339_c0_g2_i1.p1 TRINITY_DN5339_c0_g2~~TRINITY_DN5339_c0_g2_i1.p1  ORF type:complete len:450 (+),score=64.25 TRINITY_DN5339_c0_g2_i1:98-1351(+)